MWGMRALRCACTGCLAVGLLMSLTSEASAATPPLTELKQARANLTALEGTGDIRAKAAVGAAVAYLGVATAESLWVDTSDAVPPPDGDVVFTDTIAAVSELKRIHNDHTISSEALASASGEILEAQVDLADIALEQVQGSSTAPGSPLKKWETAFSVLGHQVTRAATSVPQSTVEQAASRFLSEEGELFAVPQPIAGEPLTEEGKPELLYYGAEGCPFCGIDRWSMAVALSQFGKFSTLGITVSATYDIDPSTHTLSFYKTHFSSKYLAFVPIEGFTNQPGEFTCGTETFPFWTTLQVPTAAQEKTILQYDGYEGCFEGIPFLDVANSWSTIGSYPNPAVVGGLSWQQIAGTLADPSSKAGQAIDGGAEMITAQICDVDGGQPARVCDSGVVQTYREAFLSGHPAARLAQTPMRQSKL
jgi:Domain of unknown function (DUF929)